jgi:hypothetical protein
LMIRLSLQPSPASDTSAFNNIRAFSIRCAALSFPQKRLQPLAFLAAQPHDILLYRNLLRSHDRLRRSRCDESESQNPHPFKLIEASD